jgi:hypothetical protein
MKHGISPAAGFVGPITRGVLNLGEMPPITSPSTAAEPDSVLLTELF